MPSDVLRSWYEQNPPKGYRVWEPPVRSIAQDNDMYVELKSSAITILGREFKDAPSLEWLADAVREKQERERRGE